jgi:hypothetical protein
MPELLSTRGRISVPNAGVRASRGDVHGTRWSDPRLAPRKPLVRAVVDVEGDRAAVVQLAPAARGGQLVFTPTLPGRGLQVLRVGMARCLSHFCSASLSLASCCVCSSIIFISSLFFRVSA